MTRKTKAERDQQRAEAERLAWDIFFPKLKALQSFADAIQLVASAPRPDSPGRRYYSNLGFFLQSFSVPDGSNYAEKAQYLRFVKQLDAAGELKAGALQGIEEALQHAMAKQGPW